MKVTLDLETYKMTVPKHYFEDIAAKNNLIEANGGNKINPVQYIKDAFEKCMADTDANLVTRK